MLIQEVHFKPETYFYVLWGSIFSNILPKLEIPLHRWKLTFLSNHLKSIKAISIYTSWAIPEKNQTRGLMIYFFESVLEFLCFLRYSYSLGIPGKTRLHH